MSISTYMWERKLKSWTWLNSRKRMPLKDREGKEWGREEWEGEKKNKCFERLTEGAFVSTLICASSLPSIISHVFKKYNTTWVQEYFICLIAWCEIAWLLDSLSNSIYVTFPYLFWFHFWKIFLHRSLVFWYLP